MPEIFSKKWRKLPCLVPILRIFALNMDKTYTIMKKILLTVMAVCMAALTTAQPERPKLVVGLVVDQMRWDYLYYYYKEYGQGGVRRLLDEGYSCENTLINYVPTVTAIGHASIYTGSVPALHGIAGNDFWNGHRFTYCCSDHSVKSVGSSSAAGEMSPRKMHATTIGDMLKVATDFKSKVIGVALKDRAAILPAGQAADAAYWWDQSAGNYVSSTYYMQELPAWVQDFNEKNHTLPNFDIKNSSPGVTMTFKMAEAALKNEKLGTRGVTDMLCVSISSTDAIGHTYGTRGRENYSVYMQFDKDLAHFLSALDKQVGRGNYLLFLSADHGAAHNSNFLSNNRIPAGGWSIHQARKELNAHLQQKYGKADIVKGNAAYKLYFDRDSLAQAGLNLDEVKAETITFLQHYDDLLYVVDLAHAAEATVPLWIREQLINGWHSQRSGDIMCITKAGLYDFSVDKNYIGTTHGAWNPYDSHIPLVFMGWKVRHGSTARTTHIVDIAPTVCAMLHIQQPNSCIGEAIGELANP